MKEEYRQPKITLLTFKTRNSILAYSYGDGIEGTNIDEEPGGPEDFG